MADSRKINLTLPGFRVGHAADRRGLTGLTVILCGRGAVSSVDVRGGAAGTRDLETCRPGHIAERAHAILLTGGSAFGLDSAAGVMRYLESRGVGFAAGSACLPPAVASQIRVSPGAVSQIRVPPVYVPPIHVPIVPAACIFDLTVGSSRSWPDAAMALRACRAAAAPGGRFVREGSVGAGTGATVGKINGIACAMKGGVGFCSIRLPAPGWGKRGSDVGKPGRDSSNLSSAPTGFRHGGAGRETTKSGGMAVRPGGKVMISRARSMEFGGRLTAGGAKNAGNSAGGATVQALAVVNALGDVLNPNDGSILAGARKNPGSPRFVGATAKMLQALDRKAFGNTTLVVIMTDAALDRTTLTQVTRKVHKGFIRAIFPVHTRFDGDLVFGLSLGRRKADVDSLGAAAVDAAAHAIARAVTCARGLGGVPSLLDLARMRQ